ncbi:hypothetical protein L1049_019394 [Liquidambar formosana]|uniref:SHSP domain-containing protein n=1 Tax=Liquidambar formosana TaxID=63359 RepID=A0AAP0X591_LIQFO
MDMPGVSKEQVMVLEEQNILIIRGKGEKKLEEEEESRRRYPSRIDLPPNLDKIDQIKAEVKNCVLKELVPKVEEEREDVFQVKID